MFANVLKKRKSYVNIISKYWKLLTKKNLIENSRIMN